MNLTIQAPQIIMICVLVLQFLNGIYVAIRKGNNKTTAIFASFIGMIIAHILYILLLYWGGFFGG